MTMCKKRKLESSILHCVNLKWIKSNNIRTVTLKLPVRNSSNPLISRYQQEYLKTNVKFQKNSKNWLTIFHGVEKLFIVKKYSQMVKEMARIREKSLYYTSERILISKIYKEY